MIFVGRRTTTEELERLLSYVFDYMDVTGRYGYGIPWPDRSHVVANLHPAAPL